MWVAQITEPANQGQHNEQLEALKQRFPAYHFSIMMGRHDPFVIAKPRPTSIMFKEDDATEVEMLRFIVTALIDEIITGHMITDGQESIAPPRRG